MGARPTRSNVSENLNQVISQTFINFSTKCRTEIGEGQFIRVNSSEVTFSEPFARNLGCIACQKMHGELMAQYLNTLADFPSTPEGDINNIARLSANVCAVACANVYANGITQESKTTYNGSCAVDTTTIRDFNNQVTANIMQSLSSNGDVLSAITDGLGGGTRLEVHNKIENLLQRHLTVNIVNDMNTNITAQQTLSLQGSSIYSAGMSQSLQLDVCRTVLIQNKVADSILNETNIDQTTIIENDENTISAGLDAAQQISDAFARAVKDTGSYFFALVVAGLVLVPILITMSIVFTVWAERSKKKLRDLCPETKPAVPSVQ